MHNLDDGARSPDCFFKVPVAEQFQNGPRHLAAPIVFAQMAAASMVELGSADLRYESYLRSQYNSSIFNVPRTWHATQRDGCH